MATNRSDLTKGMAADMHKWYYEGAEEYYKKAKPVYDKLADVKPLKGNVTGSYWQSTSALGLYQLESRDEDSPYPVFSPTEGYTVYGAVKNKAIKISVNYELARDWHRTQDFLRGIIKAQGAEAVERTKEKLVADLFNYGSYTAGNAVFNQDVSAVGLSTGHGDKIYDSAQFLSLSGTSTAHSSKAGTSYYNEINASDTTDKISQADLKTAWNLLTSTNAKLENDQVFDNSQDVMLVVCPGVEIEAMAVLNSTLNPDNAENKTNPFKGKLELVRNSYLTDTDCWALHRKGGIKFFVSEPKFMFWEQQDPLKYYAAIILDYVLVVQNWRLTVGVNFPQS